MVSRVPSQLPNRVVALFDFAASRLRVSLFFILAFVSVSSADEPKVSPKPHECRFTELPIVIDGKADDKAWAAAEVIDSFQLPWLGKEARPAKTATTARLLWDRDNLYFFADMVDADLYADVTEHDGDTWDNDVF